MTMSRETKTKVTTTYREFLAGDRPAYSVSPRLLAQYGRYMPAMECAKIHTSEIRDTTADTREHWTRMRLGRRLRRERVL